MHIEGKCHQKLPKNKLDTLCKVSFYKSSKFIDFFPYKSVHLHRITSMRYKPLKDCCILGRYRNQFLGWQKLNLNLHTYNLFVYQYFECRRPQKVFFAECILVLLLNKVKEIFEQYDNRKNKDNIMFNSI